MKSWQRFWWPKVDTPENAASAARNGGVAFLFIALASAIWLTRMRVLRHQALLREMQLFRDHPHPPPQHHGLVGAGIVLPDPMVEHTVHALVILLIAALLAWRAYKRPNLLLCTIALVWVLFDFVGAPALVWTQHDFFPVRRDVLGVGIYCSQILGTVAGLGGVRGAWAARRFGQSRPEVVV